MIEAFGDYHRVFWNCQTFAKCFLQVICEESTASFDAWTIADTSNLVSPSSPRPFLFFCHSLVHITNDSFSAPLSSAFQ